jgi:hypothetical protein
LSAPVLQPLAHHYLALLLLRLLEHLLDDLLLLNEECSDNTVLDAVRAAGATVRTLDGLLGLGDGGVLAGSEGRDLQKSLLALLCHKRIPS